MGRPEHAGSPPVVGQRRWKGKEYLPRCEEISAGTVCRLGCVRRLTAHPESQHEIMAPAQRRAGSPQPP